MLMQLEDAAIVSPNSFKNAVSVKQPVIEHRDFGVLRIIVFAVNVNFHALAALKLRKGLRQSNSGIRAACGLTGLAASSRVLAIN
jgi:hypothetical protein